MEQKQFIAKDRLYNVLTNLRELEVKGEINVRILAQTFIDLTEVIQQMDADENDKAEKKDK